MIYTVVHNVNRVISAHLYAVTGSNILQSETHKHEHINNNNTINNNIHIYRARQKSNSLGKIRYLWNCNFSKLIVLKEEDSNHIFCKFH